MPALALCLVTDWYYSYYAESYPTRATGPSILWQAMVQSGCSRKHWPSPYPQWKTMVADEDQHNSGHNGHEHDSSVCHFVELIPPSRLYPVY